MTEFILQLKRIFSSAHVKSKYSAKQAFMAFFLQRGWKMLESPYGDVVARDPNGTIHIVKIWWKDQDTPKFFLENFLELIKEKNATCQSEHRFTARCKTCQEECPISQKIKLYFFSNRPLGYEAYQYFKENELYVNLVLSPEARKYIALRKLKKRQEELPQTLAQLSSQKTLDSFWAKTASTASS